MKDVRTFTDLRNRAKRGLPRILFDYIEGGAGDERSLHRNRQVFDNVAFLPRYLRDVTDRSQVKILLGQRYDSPYGIAPMGFAGLTWPQGDLLLAQAAREANIPFVMSGSSNSSLEKAASKAPDHSWYQLYMAQDARISHDMIHRAEAAGYEVLVVTIDLPVAAQRERDLRNGFDLPMRRPGLLFIDGLLHLRWSLRYLMAGGLPIMENWAPYFPDAASPAATARATMAQSFAVQTWADIHKIRDMWPHKLLLKGVLHPDDAKQAAAAGVDGVIVSNHGGRQLDRCPAAIEVLADIRRAVGPDFPLIVDGGIRNGADVLACLALGADFVLVGRMIMYGLAAGGLTGAARAISILRDDLDVLLGQTGCTRLDEIPDDLLMKTERALHAY